MASDSFLPPTSPAAGLALLGTVHSDPHGFERTEAFLKRHGPDLVFVELSPFALRYRKENARALREDFFQNLHAAAKLAGMDRETALKHARIESILRQIGLPFEYGAASAYGDRAGVQVLAADHSEFSREWISTWQEMICPENLRELLLMEDTEVPVAARYERAARRIRGAPGGPEIFPGGEIFPWQAREEHIAGEIRSALGRVRPARPLYIGGWWHLASSGGRVRTLREILEVGPSNCFLLDRGPVF